MPKPERFREIAGDLGQCAEVRCNKTRNIVDATTAYAAQRRMTRLCLTPKAEIIPTGWILCLARNSALAAVFKGIPCASYHRTGATEVTVCPAFVRVG